MLPRARSACFAALAALGFLLPACSSSPTPTGPPGSDRSVEEGLPEIVELYNYLDYSKLPLPRNEQELLEYSENVPSTLKRLQAKELVLHYGVPLRKGGTPLVIAYEKSTPESGGYVLLQDGTVKKMTPEEFAAAPKPR